MRKKSLKSNMRKNQVKYKKELDKFIPKEVYSTDKKE